MVTQRRLDCLSFDSGHTATDQTDGSAPLVLHAVRPQGLDSWLETQPASVAAFVKASDFTAAIHELRLLPSPDAPGGLAGAVLGLGEDRSPFPFGKLALDLPKDSTWRFKEGDYDLADAVLGFCLGAYRFDTYRKPSRAPARLVLDKTLSDRPDLRTAQILAESIWLARDLINTPANELGPIDLARTAQDVAMACQAQVQIIEGAALAEAYPTIAAVGAGSERAPAVVSFTWHGSQAAPSAPLIALCGKGVCFDTGGYDLKPSSAMLRMKKDMGGAAITLGLARAIMLADLPVRLSVRLGCVENSVSGHAMRPSDILRTRRGLNVEVGNTDAEGRLVLCDLLAEASDERPDLVVDIATLTGAARVALGPDVPALFSNDDTWAQDLTTTGQDTHDPLWRLPLWDGYDNWLKSPVADLNNVSSKPFAGAITAALFLRRFVEKNVPWVHIDTYAWNDSTRPGRPEGGEAQTLRAIFWAISRRFHLGENNRNRSVA